MIADGYKDTKIGIIPKEWEVKELKDIVYKDRQITYGIVQPGKNTFKLIVKKIRNRIKNDKL